MAAGIPCSLAFASCFKLWTRDLKTVFDMFSPFSIRHSGLPPQIWIFREVGEGGSFTGDLPGQKADAPPLPYYCLVLFFPFICRK